MVGTIIAHLTKTGIVKYQADNVFRMVSGLLLSSEWLTQLWLLAVIVMMVWAA